MKDIAGSDEALQGKAASASALRVRGSDLIVTLKAPTPDLVFKTVTVGYCAVPVALPLDPEGWARRFPEPADAGLEAGRLQRLPFRTRPRRRPPSPSAKRTSGALDTPDDPLPVPTLILVTRRTTMSL
jgi:hypothetical protein